MIVCRRHRSTFADHIFSTVSVIIYSHNTPLEPSKQRDTPTFDKIILCHAKTSIKSSMICEDEYRESRPWSASSASKLRWSLEAPSDPGKRECQTCNTKNTGWVTVKNINHPLQNLMSSYQDLALSKVYFHQPCALHTRFFTAREKDKEASDLLSTRSSGPYSTLNRPLTMKIVFCTLNDHLGFYSKGTRMLESGRHRALDLLGIHKDRSYIYLAISVQWTIWHLGVAQAVHQVQEDTKYSPMYESKQRTASSYCKEVHKWI